MEGLTALQVVEMINENSASVVDKILDLYGNKVLKLCYLQLGNKEEAEDATQEVFLKLLKNINKYNGNGGVYTWVYRITINTCFDILKKRNKFRLEDLALYIDYIPTNKDVENEILEKIDSISLRNALMEIPEKYRVILYMFYFEEIKISIIASIFDENENTIKTKLRRGKNALKRVLEKGGCYNG